MKTVRVKILFIAAAISSIYFLESCGAAETKADVSDTLKSNNEAKQEPAAVTDSSRTPVTGQNNGNSTQINVKNPTAEKTQLLTNIDNYLVSTINAEQGTITVENKLPAMDVQKAIAEVVFSGTNGNEASREYYILENIEPNTSKSARLKTSPFGSLITVHIVKLKSDQLTGGELIIVGNKYSPN